MAAFASFIVPYDLIATVGHLSLGVIFAHLPSEC